jgi:hypothetical protein
VWTGRRHYGGLPPLSTASLALWTTLWKTGAGASKGFAVRQQLNAAQFGSAVNIVRIQWDSADTLAAPTSRANLAAMCISTRRMKRL